MISQLTSARAMTHSSNARHAAAVGSLTAYILALANIRVSASGVTQALADPESTRLVQHRRAARDVGQRESTVPQPDRFVVALATRLAAGHDLAEFGVQ